MQTNIKLTAQDIIKLIMEKRVKIGEYTISPDSSYLSVINLLYETINESAKS